MNQELLIIVQALQKSLPKRASFEISSAETLFKAKKYALLISKIKNHMGVTCHVRFKPMPKTEQSFKFMTIDLPLAFPWYGSAEYERLSLDIFYHKEVLNNFYVFVLAVSHELAHVVLYSINHHLKMSEQATDITAMLLGFTTFFELGHTRIETEFFERHITRTSYLSFKELIDVLNIIDP